MGKDFVAKTLETVIQEDLDELNGETGEDDDEDEGEWEDDDEGGGSEDESEENEDDESENKAADSEIPEEGSDKKGEEEKEGGGEDDSSGDSDGSDDGWSPVQWVDLLDDKKDKVVFGLKVYTQTKEPAVITGRLKLGEKTEVFP